MTAKEKLAKLIKNGGYGANAKLARHLGVKPTFITRWSDEKYSERFPVEYYEKTADFFDISPNYFFNDDNSELLYDIKFIPIIGEASCGIPLENNYQDYENKTFCTRAEWNDKLYAIVASGDSMSPDIENGDIVVCDPTAQILSGDIVHYQIGNESALKVYCEKPKIGVVEFMPINRNGDFKTLSFRVDDEYYQFLKMVKAVKINKSIANNRKERLRNLGVN
ncbi:S24 family peptidase [Campylobacter sp. CN_NA1]|uniref:S24 family peptidase n=1 Tax=Campylobacter sp. CN_NA1 TaxID=2984150 RepID=UPI0022EA00FA|nr:S24 family peptidase [Campylobacter sp. CN_NA1]MDA3056453.1 S24 family peptidase [Campylobacter sp. CN_NA1]